MNLIGGLLGGVVGGLIGAAIWIAIGYWTGYEVGWIAWGIGALVGVGVQVGARRKGGLPGGGTAVILAIAAILAGKWAVVRIEVDRVFGGDDVVISYIADVIIAEHDERGETVLMPPETMEVDTIPETYPTSIWMQAMQRWQALDAQQQDELRALPALANDQLILVYIADTVVEEYEQEGRSLAWPPGMDFETAWRAPHYPPDVWAEGVRRWEEMSPPEQAEYSSTVKAFLTELATEAESQEVADLIQYGFMQSFSLFDILWAVLAIGTAAKLGAAGARVEAAETAAGDPDPQG
ncbi:MAG: hypothetical protein ACYTA3_03140 [Planctomycetota bacterium]|jgi:hypothetical protein